MIRSPLARFLLATGLILVIVLATFLYGNSQRSHQEEAKQSAHQAEIRKQSNEKRESQKRSVQQAPSKSVLPDNTAPSTVKPNPTRTITPPTERIPATGGFGLSTLLATLSLPILVALTRHKSILAAQRGSRPSIL